MEKQISDEQAEKLGAEVCSLLCHLESQAEKIRLGHAAYAACEALTREQHAREMLAEPTKEELVAGWNAKGATWDGIARTIFAHRLAKYTAKPDPRVALVLRKLGLCATESGIAAANEFLAELDAARKEQANDC